MRIEDWRAGGRTFRHGELEIFYRDDGAGAPLVCIHGFPSASWDWHKLWPDLTARWRVIAPDMLGFGFSAKPPHHPYTLVEQADLHAALLAALGIDAAHLLVHDYGVSVAQELLARDLARRAGADGGAGFRPLSVCFLNGGLFPELHRARLVQRLLDSPLGPLLARWTTAARFRRGFTAVFGPHTQPSEAELDAVWQLNALHDGWRVMPRLIGYLDERRRHRARWVGALRATPVPLRLINGPEDPVSGRHMAEGYRAQVPDADVVLLDGIGHYPQLEAPAAVLAAYLAFRARID